MLEFNNILAGINFTRRDDIVIRFAKKISELANSQRVYFVHSVERVDIPKEIIRQYPELRPKTPEELKQDIKKKIEGYFDSSTRTEVVIEVVEDNPLVRLLKTAKEKYADLIIIGRAHSIKYSSTMAGRLPERLTRKSPCSVLIVLEDSNPEAIKNILVPVRFARPSRLALEKAIEIAETVQASITCQCLFYVPAGYHKTGKTYQKVAEIMLNNCKNTYEKWVKEIDLKGVELNPMFTLTTENRQADDIAGTAEKGYDFLVIGSTVKSAPAAVLLGKTAEELIWKTIVPMLVVKEKGVTLKLLDVLLYGDEMPAF
nr:universal stress protein [Desulfobacterales bacterium]